MILYDCDGQMILGVLWGPIASWHLLQVCKIPEKNHCPGNLSRRRSNPGPLRLLPPAPSYFVDALRNYSELQSSQSCLILKLSTLSQNKLWNAVIIIPRYISKLSKINEEARNCCRHRLSAGIKCWKQMSSFHSNPASAIRHSSLWRCHSIVCTDKVHHIVFSAPCTLRPLSGTCFIQNLVPNCYHTWILTV